MHPSEKDPQTYAIIGAALEVHKNLGTGFLEKVYQEALEIELKARNIPHKREAEIKVIYKGHTLGAPYKADFICYNEIIIELKAKSTLTEQDKAQVIHYLEATQLKRALLMNFKSNSLDYRRIVLNYP